MSKQSEAKARQGYDPKPVVPICGNCRYFKSDSKIRPDDSYPWKSVQYDTDIRCDFHGAGFAVKKDARCNCHQFNDRA